MTGFSLLNPLLALGVLGVAAPVLIHFFFRRRAQVLEFPAMRYVLLSYHKVARKLLLQEYLLLAARCLMVALLALALAGPGCSRLMAGIRRGERPLAMIFVLDTSASMTRPGNRGTLLEAAKKNIREWLAQTRDGDRFGLLDACRLTGTGLGDDPAKVREFLLGINPYYGPARMNQALRLAAAQISDLAEMDRVIVVFTDMQRTGWTGPVAAAPGLPRVEVVDLAKNLKPDNLSVAGLEIKWKALAREQAVQIKARVNNYGERDARKVVVKILFGETTAAQGFVDVPAHGETEKEMVLTDVPAGPGALRLEAADGMAADNVAYFLLKGGRQVRALLVDGDPGTDYLESETYYLEQALNPRLYARSRIDPLTVTVAELSSARLADYQVVVLANVARLDAKTAARLKEFVKTGGGLLITLGGQVDADAYNAMFGELLPRELRGVKQPYAGPRGAGEVRIMHLETPAPSGHPILSVFPDPSQGDLGLAGFRKYFLLQQEVVPNSRVILRLTDGTPMMVEARHGRGKVILFASSADRAWNDLCIHPTYLPLVQQTVQYLADALLSQDQGRTTVGSVIEVPVAPDVTGARVMAPDGNVSDADLIEKDGARRIKIGSTELPGVYYLRFRRRGVDLPSRFNTARADRGIVVNIDPAESNLARISADQIKARTGATDLRVLTPGATPAANEPAAVATKSYAGVLLLMLVGLAVLERALVRKG